MKRDEWNKVLDRYILTATLTVDDYENLNEIQQTIIQEIKKSYKRINYANKKLLDI